MKGNEKLAGEYLAKGENDLKAARIGLQHDAPLDTVRFHVHQAAEKTLKALLSRAEIRFPHTHDLDALLDLSIPLYPELGRFRTLLEGFAPYAVEIRYSTSFYPSAEEAQAGLDAAEDVAQEVRRILTVLNSAEQQKDR